MKSGKKHGMLKRIPVMLFALVLFLTPVSASAAFQYEHDPMENPKVVQDIVVNPDAVYGYSPNPASVRLGPYADAIDWTDEAQVAAARASRAAYLEKDAELYQTISQMRSEGKETEEIARTVSKRRNELRLEAYDGDPDGLAIVKKSNLDTYGNEEGPTPEYLYERYGSWETVMEKALSSNPGMDACLGFYDELYDSYMLPAAEQPAEEPEQPAEQPPEQPAEQSVPQPTEQPSEQPAAQPPHQPAVQPSPTVKSPATGEASSPTVLWIVLSVVFASTAIREAGKSRREKRENDENSKSGGKH